MYQLELFNKKNGSVQIWKGTLVSVLKEGCDFLRDILYLVDPNDIHWKMWRVSTGQIVFELDESDDLPDTTTINVNVESWQSGLMQRS